jgi:hypothetical protein
LNKRLRCDKIIAGLKSQNPNSVVVPVIVSKVIWVLRPRPGRVIWSKSRSKTHGGCLPKNIGDRFSTKSKSFFLNRANRAWIFGLLRKAVAFFIILEKKNHEKEENYNFSRPQ